jgi:hypothetical protein
MPLWRNILDEGGVGNLLSSRESEQFRAPLSFWIVGTGVALVGSTGVLRSLISAIVSLYQGLRDRGERCHQWQLVLFLSLTAVCFVPVPLAGWGLFGAHDRYILVFITLTLGIFASIPRMSAATLPSIILRRAGFVLLLIYAVFSVAATHDYLAWNRVRWTALQQLINESKIPINHIQGSFEFYGWYRYDKSPTREWWPEKHYEYLVSFNRHDGYQVIKQYPVRWWLPWQRGSILVEQENAGAS